MFNRRSLTTMIGAVLICTACSKGSEPTNESSAPVAQPPVVSVPATSALPPADSPAAVITPDTANAAASTPAMPKVTGGPSVASSAIAPAATAMDNPHTSTATVEGDGGDGSELVGVVKSTIEVPDSKTMYLEIESNGQITWVASKSMEIKSGDKVRVPSGGLIMENFTSKSLGRTFERLLMTSEVSKVE